MSIWLALGSLPNPSEVRRCRFLMRLHSPQFCFCIRQVRHIRQSQGAQCLCQEHLSITRIEAKKNAPPIAGFIEQVMVCSEEYLAFALRFCSGSCVRRVSRQHWLHRCCSSRVAPLPRSLLHRRIWSRLYSGWGGPDHA